MTANQKKIGYARVSTGDQNLDLQRDALIKASCTEIYEKKASGKNVECIELEHFCGRCDQEIRYASGAWTDWAGHFLTWCASLATWRAAALPSNRSPRRSKQAVLAVS